jgi:TonB family protein
MNKMIVLILGLYLLVPLAWGQGLDEINVVEMSWVFNCYQGIRTGQTPPPPSRLLRSYAEPAFFDVGRDENLLKERDLIKKTFNLNDVRPMAQEELWLRQNEPAGVISIDRENGLPLSIELERLDTSWLHYRVTVYESNAETKAVMRSAFTIPSSMTLKDAVVFGFEDSGGNPVFLSLRISNLFADGEMPGKAAAGIPMKRLVQASSGEAAGKPTEKPVIIPPRLSRRVPPIYPEAAKKAGVEGTVVLSVSLDDKGQVVRARVLKSIPELDQAALEAVRQWTYEPMTVNGTPKPIVFTVQVEFKR